MTADDITAQAKLDSSFLLSDVALDYASALDDLAFARYASALKSAGVKAGAVQEFVRFAKRRRAASKADDGVDSGPYDDRPRIPVTTNEDEVNDKASDALYRIEGLYSRMGELVQIVESKRRRPGEAELYYTFDIRMVPEALLRGYMSRAAVWLDADSGMMPTRPPDWCVKNVKARFDWPTVPPLYLVAEFPVLLHDGRVLQTRGYDAASGIMCNTKVTVSVPDAVTRDDCASCGATLLDLVCDVPFETEAHRSAWLASLLTVIARWAFSGQCPLFMLTTNIPGVGKGMLVNLVSDIVLGHPCDYTTQISDDDEERKFITSKVITGQPMVWIDECTKPFGSGPMQGLLTSGTWAPRLLGTNDSPSFDAYIVWFAAGVNVQFKSSDILRRCAVIRLVTELPKPEERTGFKYNLEEYVPAHRAELLGAALTMLRGWMLSGMKPVDLEGWGGTWGGFDDWDRVVRGAIVYAGLADPIAAKATNVAQTVKEGLTELVVGLEEAIASIGKSGEATTSAIQDALAANDKERKRGYSAGPVEPENFVTLRKGITALSPYLKGFTPSVSQLGTLLGNSKEQQVPCGDGSKWIKARMVNHVSLWRVESIAAPHVEPLDPYADAY